MVRHDKGSVAAWRLTVGIARKRVRVLRDGEIEDDPFKARILGDRRVKLVRRLDSGRMAGVVTVIASRDTLILVTAEWGAMRQPDLKHSAAQPALFNYAFCGLGGVYLAGGIEGVRTDYGPGVAIQHLDRLHRAIGEHIARSRSIGLIGAEVRFLRQTIGCTQVELAQLLGTTDQAVARWEKGKTAIPGSADILLRAILLQHVGKPVDLRMLGVSLRVACGKPEARAVFERTGRGWRARAA
jgi:DNA-binding transcriptional regulator YiaG